MELLSLPSARWTGRAWIDENDLEYPADGIKSLGKCPRRIGLVSQGLVVRGLSEAVTQLLSRQYTIIVDEAHRARRRKVPKVDASAEEINERAEPNKLMDFLRQIGPKTKSMLLATAIPSRKAWDLLHILSHGNACSEDGHRPARGFRQRAWPPQVMRRFRLMMHVMAGNACAIRCPQI